MQLLNIVNPEKRRAYLYFLKLKLRKIHPDARASYSQTAEDIHIQKALRVLGITTPRYLDIGAHHASKGSNSFIFYRDGARGVCIEPNPKLAAAFKRKRPHDTVLQTAIGVSSDPVTLFITNHSELSTTSKEQLHYIEQSEKHAVIDKLQAPSQTIMDVIDTHFPNKPPDFISLDIEGLDLAVLKTFDFERSRPPVMCIETLAHDEHGYAYKEKEIFSLMERNAYAIYADTYLSTIFVDTKAWCQKARQRPEGLLVAKIR